MKEKSFSPHKAAIFSLFILGEAGILIPYKNTNDKSFLGFLIGMLFGGLIILLSFFLINKLTALKNDNLKKYLLSFIFLAVSAYCIYLSINCFNVFLDFVSQYVLPDFSKYIIGLIFATMVFVLAKSQITTLYKLGIITAILSAILLAVLFIFSIPQFSLDNISLLSFPDFKELSLQSFNYLKLTFLPLIVLPFFEFIYGEKGQNKSLLSGYLSGAVMLMVCILNSLLIFGSNLSAKLDFPYSEAIATVTAGNIFTRMDGFSYFVFFISCLVKICLCLKLFVSLLKCIYCTFKKESKNKL